MAELTPVAQVASEILRLRVEVEGAVQGVGFRPAAYRLAAELGVCGWVTNTPQGVLLELEGAPERLESFVARLRTEAPPLAIVRAVRTQEVAAQGERGFAIRASLHDGAPHALLLPDAATCPECLADIERVGDRRYRYPFTNCTHCGPRFSIIESLPYDRPRTTMRGFALCPDCRREYEAPDDRRFHAQPTACPACGPQLSYHARNGGAWVESATGDAALEAAASALAAGRIVAVKGLGGVHLLCDAADEEAVRTLRKRKARPAKPLALMARTLEEARTLIEIGPEEAALLCSPAAPIVLAPRAEGAPVAPSVAPGAPTLGVLLAYTPLHHLLLGRLGRAVVATSGNLSDEPICTDNADALARLGAIADAFLLHDRPIARPVDDSVARVIDGAPRLLRRARGYAPLPVHGTQELPPLLAVGGHLKSTVAVSVGRDVFLSQHLGDLGSPQAQAAFERTIADLLRLYAVAPVAVAHDLHPDYASTRWAQAWAARRSIPCVGVQHHHAHLAACLAENGSPGPALGVTWDGSGDGGDGTVWGGEFLAGDAAGFVRAAHLRPFSLPGGEAAVREPRRCALALLQEIGATDAPLDGFAPRERALLEQMAAQGVNTPRTTSAGRLFDGIAALLGLRAKASFEGQAALELEACADPGERGAYPMQVTVSGGVLLLDWEPLLRALLEERQRGVACARMAARAQRGLAQGIVQVAQRVGLERVALTGGCFQNKLLTEWAAAGLRAAGFTVLLHRHVPPNDGGLSLGQVVVASSAVAYSVLRAPYPVLHGVSIVAAASAAEEGLRRRDQ